MFKAKYVTIPKRKIPESWENYLNCQFEQFKNLEPFKIKTEEHYFLKALMKLNSHNYDINLWIDKYERQRKIRELIKH